MSLKNKRVLVTGADGFIGSHLTEALVKMGCKTRAFVYYNSFNSWGWLDHSPTEIKSNLDIFSGDIRDPNGVRTAMKDIDVVFHLAALIAIPYSYHSPDTYIDTNVKGTLNVVQAAKDLNIEKILHTSTSEVYGSGKTFPMNEEHPLKGQSPYSASKIGADQIAYSFFASFNTPVSIVRPFNTYGPRQSARAIIPTLISQILSGSKKIKAGSMTPTRDFNFIEDTVRGFISIAESNKTNGEVINLGTGSEFSIQRTFELIQEITGKKVELEQDHQRIRPENSEVDRLCADNSKAKKLASWEPLYGGEAGFKKGLEKTIQWFSDPKNLASYKQGIYNL